MIRLRWSAFLFITILASSLHAQTTGSTIIGRVTDPSGAVLPGVTVDARSPALQGARVTTTDNSGLYRLALLPPGGYVVTFSLDGFVSERRSPVIVSLGKETNLDVSLRPGAAQEITVTGEAPVITTTTTAQGTALNERAIDTLPTGRNYSALAQIAPGTSSDANPENTTQNSITVYGSSGAENAFFVDGVNTTGVEYGFQGKELNFEFIQEIDVKTGGYEAEFGRATGGIVNVITKSGGNEFTGDVFGYFDDDGFQSSPKDVVSTGGTVEGFTKQDYGVDVGGYFIRDVLWFFAAYDKVQNTTQSELPGGPLAGEIAESESNRDLAAAKLTWRLTDRQSLIGSFFQDPRDDTGAINDAQHSLNGDPSTYLGKKEFGGRDYAVRYEGLFGSSWVLSGQIARHEEQNSVGPATAEGDEVQFRDVAQDFFQTGGFGLIQNKDFSRDFYGGSATLFLGVHEFKAGAEYEEQSAEVVKRMSGGQQVDIFSNEANPARPIYQHFYWTTPTATVGNAPLSQLTASPQHKNTTAFLQDRWSIRPNLILNAGVRWDRQEIIDAEGTRQIDLSKDYAPRLGIIWDPGSDRRSKLFASFGKYYEQIPMDLVIRSFSFERQPRIVNFDPLSNVPDPQAEADFGTDSGIFGGFTEPSDPDIKNQYLDEYIIGAERELFPNFAVGVKGIYRSYGNVVEDFLCADDGTYCIGNPARGIMERIFTLDYSQTFEAPEPKRIYRGVQFDATKRFDRNWQALASYIYSTLEGNFDGEYAPFTNVGADPNISAAYDYYDFFTNGSDLHTITNRGDLSNDRRHQFKVSGLYITPLKFELGASAYWRSGTPLTRYGYSDAYGRYEFFLTERGGEGRNPSNYEMDFHVGYPLAVGPTTVNLLLDIFNVLNAQRPVLLDQRWGFQESDNASPTPVNENYGEPVLRTPPTSVRLGVRVSF